MQGADIGIPCRHDGFVHKDMALTASQTGYDPMFSPAEDGGYVLIGLNAPQPVLFTGMTWGNQTVMAQTRRRAADANLTVYGLSTQWDIDNSGF